MSDATSGIEGEFLPAFRIGPATSSRTRWLMREARAALRPANDDQNGKVNLLFWMVEKSCLMRLVSEPAVGVVRLTKSNTLPSFMP
jgi:hypothetical protein